MTSYTGYSLILLVAVALCGLSWFFYKAANALALAVMNYFQVDGGATVGPVPVSKGCTPAGFPVLTADHVGGPSRVVDASNSPNVAVRLRCGGTPDVSVKIEGTPDGVNWHAVSPLTEDEKDDVRKLAALVEFHRVTIANPLPPSRSIRKSQVH